MPENWQDELSQFDNEYRETKEPEGTGGYDTPVPDGNYQAKIKSVELKHAKASGAPMVSWCFEIVGGDRNFLGRWLWKNAVIREGSLGYIKKDLALFGIRLSKFSTLPAYLPRLVGKVVVLKKEVSNGFSNIYLNQVLSQSVAPADAGEAPAEETDQVPF